MLRTYNSFKAEPPERGLHDSGFADVRYFPCSTLASEVNWSVLTHRCSVQNRDW